jgi:hypothetical protein
MTESSATPAAVADSERELEQIFDLLERVPEFEVFPTVDEMTANVEQLAAAHPETTRLRRVGSSRLGEPLLCLTVGSGSRQALVFAMPHPNEPIGAITAGELARMLCEDAQLCESIGFTWHIVPCIDPDGTRLNEGWFKGPFTRSNYARHFYRPATDDQVEWTFPFAYKDAYFDRVLPETLALMRLIDESKPDFMCSLHNAESGGVYYYLSRPAPELYPALQSIPGRFGLPLDLGEPEVPYAPVFAPAIFGQISRAASYDYLERAGQNPIDGVYGESSAHYASRYGTLSLISELPYWADESADNEAEAGAVYADALRRLADAIAEVAAAMRDAVAAAGGGLIETPFLRASDCFMTTMEKHVGLTRWRAEQPENARPATVAEQKSCRELVHMYRTRFPGILLRAFAAQIDSGLAAPPVRQAHRTLAEQFERWCSEAEQETPGSMLPIRGLVATQLGSILAAVRYLNEQPTAGA